jgi:cystathionine beta-lyase
MKDLSKILNQLGEDREMYFNAVSPPVIQTSNFAFDSVESMRDQLLNEFKHTLYTRGNNPTTDILREKIAALEGTEDALVLSSGSSAVTCAIMANVASGDHIVCVKNPYTWTKKLLNDIMPRFGVTTTYVDGTHIDNFKNAIKSSTKIIYLESPNSFTFEIQNLEAVSELARTKGILTIIDNSYSSSVFQQPHTFGIDLIVHSATKYLAGHSDVVAGVICGSGKMIQKIFNTEFMTLGTKLSPWDSWLMIRGLRTLEIRMERINESGRKLVDFISQRPEIEKVYYPFHSENPQLELARKQMSGCGGMFTVALKTRDVNKIEKFCNSLECFLLAVSWGGYESLIFPATAASEKTSEENKANVNLMRFYIGLEDPEMLIRDIEKALVILQD